MISAKTAIIRASPFDWRVVNQWHFWRLNENFTAAAVILDIIRDKYPLAPVLWATLKEKDLAVLKDSLGLDLSITSRADRDHDVVEKIWAFFITHGLSPQKAI
jgi:hypothetical protein